jgi:hypothetical protein
MKSKLLKAFGILALFGLMATAAAAQFPVKLPKIPKVKTESTPFPAGNPATSSSSETKQPAGGPTIVKTRIQFRAWTVNSYKDDFKVWSWIPLIKLTVDGALPSGAHFYVEVAQPSGAAWVKAQCVHQGASTYECGDRDRLKGSETLETGVFRFTIKLRNELAGTEQTHFTGRAKIEKALSNEAGPQAARKFVYFANHDFNLPIGQVYYDDNDNLLRVKFWIRGAEGQIEPHLFYRGQEVITNSGGVIFKSGSCSPDIEFQPTQYATEKLPQRALWARIDCRLEGANVKPLASKPRDHAISSKPGDYEVKVLRNGMLARSIKFTVGSDGQIVNSGAGASVGMPHIYFVPVAILDDQDGPWDKTTWKTEALYGNPLAGFAWRLQ